MLIHGRPPRFIQGQWGTSDDAQLVPITSACPFDGSLQSSRGIPDRKSGVSLGHDLAGWHGPDNVRPFCSWNVVSRDWRSLRDRDQLSVRIQCARRASRSGRPERDLGPVLQKQSPGPTSHVAGRVCNPAQAGGSVWPRSRRIPPGGDPGVSGGTDPVPPDRGRIDPRADRSAGTPSTSCGAGCDPPGTRRGTHASGPAHPLRSRSPA